MSHVTREASAYRLPERKEGTEGSEGKAVGRKVWAFDDSENESNLKGMKKV